METSTITLLILAIFGWGTAAFFDKLAVNYIGSKAVFIVYFASGIVAISYFLLLGKATPIESSKGAMFAIVAGAFAAIAGLGYYTAIQKENISLATPFVALYPIITVLLGVLILHEKLKLANAVGIILAFVAGFLLTL